MPADTAEGEKRARNATDDRWFVCLTRPNPPVSGTKDISVGSGIAGMWGAHYTGTQTHSATPIIAKGHSQYSSKEDAWKPYRTTAVSLSHRVWSDC